MYKALRGQTSGKPETKTLLGKDYLVVPVVAMIEGVRFGANQTSGELGLASEFGKFVDGWNTSPVVLSHPQIDGEFVSAGNPAVLEDYYLGEIFHTQMRDKKLRMEAWLDPDAKGKSDDFARVFERIEAGETIEVSVGFFTEVEETDGSFKGQSYTGVWRNIVPDHLAFLKEGEIGACSVKDGCGTPRTNKASKKRKDKMPETQEGGCTCKDTPKDMAAQLASINTNSSSPHWGERQQARALMTQNFIAQSVPNDLLSSDVVRSLSDALNDVYSYAYVIGYTPEYVVYESYNGDTNNWMLCRQNFNVNSDGVVTFTSDPEEIRLITRIVPATAAEDVTVNSTPQTKETSMSKTTKPKIQAGEGAPTEGAEAPAPATTEANPAGAESTAETAPAAAETPATETAPTTQAVKTQTVQEYIEQAPAEMREVLQSSIRLHSDRKNTLIANLKKTGRCNMSDDFLKAQTLETLENLAKLADVPSYEGAAVPVRTQSADDSAAPAAPRVFEKKTA